MTDALFVTHLDAGFGKATIFNLILRGLQRKEPLTFGSGRAVACCTQEPDTVMC